MDTRTRCRRWGVGSGRLSRIRTRPRARLRKSWCATPTNVFAGFVAVGLAQATGKRYVPGSDDLVVDNGQHSFEFVVPWKLSKVNPEYAYKSGGEVLRLSGTHFRPGMLCTFKDSSLTSEYRFISSALAMCETRASSEAEGTVDLNLTPTHAVGGGGGERRVPNRAHHRWAFSVHHRSWW